MSENTIENTYSPPVSALLTTGDAHRSTDWPDYLAYGLSHEDVPELIRMAGDPALHWADSESAAVWAPVHAWRALGQLRATAAIEPLVNLLHQVDEVDDDWFGEELPKVLALIGPEAIAALGAFLRDAQHGLWARVAASVSLEKIGEQYPASRTECVAVLTDQLRQFSGQDPTLNASLIADLVDLEAIEAGPMIEAAFAANQVDLSVQGDWEEVQIELGLLSERLTPPPKGGWLPAFLTDGLRPPPKKPDPAIVAKREQEEAVRAKRRRTNKLAKATKQKQIRQKKSKKKR